MLVTFLDSIQKLVEVLLNLEIVQRSLASVKKLLQILIEEFENQCQFSVGMQHVDEANDVWVLKLFEQRDLSDSSRWNALILRLESNLF